MRFNAEEFDQIKGLTWDFERKTGIKGFKGE